MTPIEFVVSRSKVKVTVTFSLGGGAYMFHRHFLFVFIVFKILNLTLNHLRIFSVYVFIKVKALFAIIDFPIPLN